MRYSHARTIAGGFRGSLRGIAVDARDRLYAAGDAEIRVFDRGGALLRRWATAGPVHTAAIAADGRVFAGESRQIEVFDDTGRVLDTWRDPERLGRVSAIGFVGRDVLAGDSHGRAIRRFDASGRFLNDIGRNNRTQGFVVPNGVVDFGVDARGIVHAANPGKHRVERYTPDGALLGHIGRFGGLDPVGFAGCCNPTNVCVRERPTEAGSDRSRTEARHLPAEAGSHRGETDARPHHRDPRPPWLPPSGGSSSTSGGSSSTSGGSSADLRIYTTEKGGPRVKVYDGTGALLAVVADSGFDPNCKNMDVAVDSRGGVYVVDTVRLEIHVFEPEAGA